MLKRSPFRSNIPPPRAVKVYTGANPSAPRAPALRVDDGCARLTIPIPKTAYIRDERLRDMCRAMSCQHCGASDGTVTWAHSNQGQHGHGRSVKASDQFVAALCWTCHSELDQGRMWSRELKVEFWTRAHRRTVARAVRMGLWPVGVPVPEVV